MAIELIVEANDAGARLVRACSELGISLRTLKRWRRAFASDGDGEDRRKGSPRLVSHRLSEEERQRILLTCNQPEYASLPPGQIVPALADQGHYIGSESSFYRVLHQAGQCQRRGRARPPQAARTVPRLRADGPNQLWSWDITYLPTTVRGVWLYLYLVIDVWSRKVVAWDVAEVESAEIAAELVQRACLKERYYRPRGFGSRQSQQQPLILHADNGNAMRVNRHRKLHHFRHRKVSHPRPGLGRRFRTGSALAGPAVPLFVHGLRGWLRWLSSVIDAGGTSPAVTPQASSAGIGGGTPPIPAEEEPPACGRNSPDRRFSLSR